VKLLHRRSDLGPSSYDTTIHTLESEVKESHLSETQALKSNESEVAADRDAAPAAIELHTEWGSGSLGEKSEYRILNIAIHAAESAE
jgi:hypothetical protein